MLLRTDISGCVLRPWQLSDKPSLLLHANNRKVWRNLTDLFPHPYAEADADAWLSAAAQTEQQEVGSIHLAIELCGDAIGGIGLIAGTGMKKYTAQFGYWLAELHWGKGIATAAARAMVAHAFSSTPFIRLEAPVFEWNAPSMRLLEKAGFVREGVLRKSILKDGQIIDCAMYAAVREAAHARRATKEA